MGFASGRGYGQAMSARSWSRSCRCSSTVAWRGGVHGEDAAEHLQEFYSGGGAEGPEMTAATAQQYGRVLTEESAASVSALERLLISARGACPQRLARAGGLLGTSYGCEAVADCPASWADPLPWLRGATEKDLLDVAGAAALLGGVDPDALHWPAKATARPRIWPRRWRCARRDRMAWVANGRQADERVPARTLWPGGHATAGACTHVWPAPQAHDAQPPAATCLHAGHRERGAERVRLPPCHGRGHRLWCHVSLAFPGPPAVVQRVLRSACLTSLRGAIDRHAARSHEARPNLTAVIHDILVHFAI